MPGKFRKAPVRRTINKMGKSIQKSKPVARKITRKPPVDTRIPNKISRRSTNISRAEQRIVKRQAVQKKLNKAQPRPRSVVRPTSRPVKSMAKQPAPPPIALKRSFKPSQPRTRPSVSAPPKSLRRGSAGVAVAGAAVAAGTLLTLKTASAHPDISLDVNSLQSTLTNLQNRSDFGDISSDLSNLDTTINHVLNLLESAREKGYVYQAEMEDIAYDAVDRWQSVRGQVEEAVVHQSKIAQSNVDDLNAYIRDLNRSIGNPSLGASALKETQDQANQVLWDIQSAENSIENNYENIENDIRTLNSRLTTIHWALDQLKEFSFNFEEGEDLVMAVANRWDKEGKDDPEGILYLSNKRLIFERKEKVATKKVLFVTTASDLVQEVVFAQPLNTLSKIKAQSKGLFGHQDFIEVEFSEGDLGKLSLHINGQDSEEWVNLIQRAKSGEIENERSSGTGISFTDLTGPLTSGDLLSIQNEVNELQDEMMLQDVRDDLSKVETEVSSLARDLADLRARGYVVEKSLEADIEVLTTQWDQVKARTESTIARQTEILGEQMTAIQDDLASLMGMSSNFKGGTSAFCPIEIFPCLC